jgi:hypothetical protein
MGVNGYTGIMAQLPSREGKVSFRFYLRPELKRALRVQAALLSTTQEALIVAILESYLPTPLQMQSDEGEMSNG